MAASPTLLDVVYAINPNYALRRDGGVATVCEACRTYDNIPHQEGFLAHIHLLMAQLLAYFDGRRTLREAVQMAADNLELDFETTLSIVQTYIENQNARVGKFGEHTQIVPKHMLIRMEQGVKYPFYVPDIFYSEKYSYIPPKRLSSPISLNLILTLSCQTNCKYCYAKRDMRQGGGFDHNAFLDLIEQAHAAKVVKVDVNGGEVLLYRHWEKVLQRLVELNYSPLISTKIPVNEDVISRLRAVGVERIQISLDSASGAICSSHLGIDGESYIRQMAHTLDLLDSVGLPTQINTVLTRENTTIPEIRRLVEFLGSHSCIQKVLFSPAGFSLYRSNFQEYAPTLEALASVRSLLESELRPSYPNLQLNMTEGEMGPGSQTDPEAFAQRSFCTANTQNAVVLPDGRVTICEELYDHPFFLIGDLRENSLLDVWNSPRALALFNLSQLDFPENSACRQCNEATSCHQSPGVCWKEILMAYGNTNHLFPDPRCVKAPSPITKYWLS